jgi:predicted amidophosphoribosyltransferase
MVAVAPRPYRAPVLHLVFPLWCACGRRAAPGAPLCDACACALRHAATAPTPAGVDQWWTAFAYEGVAREVVARAKYREMRAAVPWLAAAIAHVLAEEATPVLHAVDVVTWAPTTPQHRRSRGFDPAELLARALARRLGLRRSGLLVRTAGPAQTGRSAAARRSGPQFQPRVPVPACVLVIDDVATTGATLTAAARALRAGGARRVFAATAARTPAPRRAFDARRSP